MGPETLVGESSRDSQLDVPATGEPPFHQDPGEGLEARRAGEGAR